MTVLNFIFVLVYLNWREIPFSVLKIGVRLDIPTLYKTNDKQSRGDLCDKDW